MARHVPWPAVISTRFKSVEFSLIISRFIYFKKCKSQCYKIYSNCDNTWNENAISNKKCTTTIYSKWKNKIKIKIYVIRRGNNNFKIWLQTAHRTKAFSEKWYIGSIWSIHHCLAEDLTSWHLIWRTKSCNIKSCKLLLVIAQTLQKHT